MMHKRLATSDHGYAITTVIFMMVIVSMIAYAALLQASNGLNLSYKQSYIQMARIASKAGVDYAKEQFDNSLCGAYTGTTEQNLVVNSRYRITFKVEVISTSSDSLSKVVKSTGSVYLPSLSTTAKYVFDIRSELIRTYAACKTPDNFAPLVWLDASNTSSLRSVTTSTTSVAPTTSYGAAGNSTRDTLEERADNGAQTAGSWASDDFEMHICDSTEFTNAICSSATSRYVYNGMIFSNASVPQGSTITSASITLACTTPAGASGSLTTRIYGLYKTSSDLHPDLFTSSGTNQIRTPVTTAGRHTTAFSDVTSNNCPPGNNTVFDVTSIVQEIVSNSNWNPGTGGGRMGFSFQRQSGSGSRHLLKNGNQLSISYSATAVSQAANGASIGEWDDLSGNANHARFAYGNAPTRQDNQINSKTVVRFNNGTMLSALTSALSAKREMTVFTVAKANFGTSASDGRFLSGMSSAGNGDTTSGTSIIPLLRNGSASGFSSIYSGSSVTYRTNYTCGGTCASTPYTYVSLFDINSGNSIDGTLKGNGQSVATHTSMAPTGSPYTFSLDQFYIGGRRTGNMAGGSGTNYMNGDYAEIVIYDHVLDCRQVEALEEYFRAKWNVTASASATACPETEIPTL